MTAFGELFSPTIYATFDGGQTFVDVGPRVPGTQVPRHATTNDPMVMVDWETGRLFMDDILPLSCGTMSWSDDQGASWLTNPYACGNSQVNDHQTIGVAKARTLPTVGYPNVVYRCVNNVAYSACARSLDGGQTFLPQLSFPYGPEYECQGLTGHLRGGPDGTIYLPKADCPSGPTIAYSQDDGITWQRLVIPTDAKATEADGHEMGLAIDELGNLYATWESGGRVFFSASADAGETWMPARDVTAPGVTATMFNALAVGAPGKVAFAYLGSTIEGGYEGKGTGNPGLEGDLFGQPELPEWDNATWNAYLGVITDALDPDAPIQSVTANDPADPLARGLCGRTRCQGMNDFIGIAIDADGRPWASFVDVCHDECVTDPSVKTRGSLGMMATLRQGPALRASEMLALPTLAPQPEVEG